MAWRYCGVCGRRNCWKKIPVFLITAEASDATMKEAYRLGVMDVISKPVVPYVVLRRVNSVVELFRARRSSWVMWWSVSSQTAGPSTEDHRPESGHD